MAVTEPIPQSMALPVQTSIVARWYVLMMMVAVYTLSIADRYSISTVMEPIRLELHLTDSGIAFLTSAIIALFYVVFGFPLSWLIDRVSRRVVIAFSVLGWSAMTLSTGLSASYSQLLLSRLGVGIGEAGGTPGANSILSDYFPAVRRPMALTIFSLGAPIGAWVAADFAGRVTDLYGWRTVFLWLGAAGVVFGIWLYVTVKEPQRGCLDHNLQANTPSFMQTMAYLWSQRSAVHVMIGSALTALWGWGLMWWTPTFLIRNYGLSVGEAGGIVAPMNLYGGIAATVLTAWLVGRPSMADPRRVVWLMGGVIGLATIASIIIYATHDLHLATALFWIFIPSIYFYIGPCFGLLNNLAEPRMRALFCAATLFVANVGNLIIAPQVVAFISDYVAPNHLANAASLRFALVCLAPVGFWATFHYFWSARRLIADQERATGIKVGNLIAT
jgi:predicted MFS family arabinose efflux permease